MLFTKPVRMEMNRYSEHLHFIVVQKMRETVILGFT